MGLTIEELMDRANDSLDFANRTDGNDKSAHSLESIACSLMAANRIELLKLDIGLQPQPPEPEQPKKKVIKTVDGKEIEL